MFKSSFKESHTGIVELPDKFDLVSFRIMMKFIYCGDLPELSSSNLNHAVNLLYLADEYLLQVLYPWFFEHVFHYSDILTVSLVYEGRVGDKADFQGFRQECDSLHAHRLYFLPQSTTGLTQFSAALFNCS